MARRDLSDSSSEKKEQKRPRGPLRTIDDDWRKKIVKRLKDLDREEGGWKQKDLAAKLGVSEGAVSNLLRMPQPKLQTRLLHAVHAALRLDPPEEDGSPEALAKNDPVLRRIRKGIARLDDADRLRVVELIERLAKTPANQ